MQKNYPGMPFVCTSINATTMTMVHKPPLGDEVRLDVPFADLGKWKVTRLKICPATTAQQLIPQSVPLAKEEQKRLQATLALYEAHEKHPVSHLQVGFAIHPMGVYTLQALKKPKALKLVPMGSLSKAKEQPPKGSITMDHGGVSWQINAWKQLQCFEDAPKSQDTLVPFWWCKPSQEEFNMEFGHVQVSTSGGTVKVPVLTNSAPVEANGLLLYQKVENPEDMEATEQGPAAKKRAKAK